MTLNNVRELKTVRYEGYHPWGRIGGAVGSVPRILLKSRNSELIINEWLIINRGN